MMVEQVFFHHSLLCFNLRFNYSPRDRCSCKYVSAMKTILQGMFGAAEWHPSYKRGNHAIACLSSSGRRFMLLIKKRKFPPHPEYSQNIVHWSDTVHTFHGGMATFFFHINALPHVRYNEWFYFLIDYISSGQVHLVRHCWSLLLRKKVKKKTLQHRFEQWK